MSFAKNCQHLTQIAHTFIHSWNVGNGQMLYDAMQNYNAISNKSWDRYIFILVVCDLRQPIFAQTDAFASNRIKQEN